MTLMDDQLRRTLGIDAPGSGSTLPPQPDGDTTGLDEYTDEPREPAKYELQEVETSVPDLERSDAKVDYVIARNHTYTLLTMTTEAIARALQVVKETEHPRAFESFNALMATARTLTQDLLGLQKVYKEVTKDRPEMTPTQATQINGDVTINAGGPQQPGNSTTNLMQLLNEAIARGEIRPAVGVGAKNGNPST